MRRVGVILLFLLLAIGFPAMAHSDPVSFNVLPDSPAWKAGLSRSMVLAAEQDLNLEPVLKSKKPGEILTLRSKLKGSMSIVLAEKEEASIAISASGNPAEKQKNCLNQWLSTPHE